MPDGNAPGNAPRRRPSAAVLLRRTPLFLAGIVVLSFGYALILRCGLGNDTLGVLAHGLSVQTGLTIGNGSQMINLTALLLVLIGNRRLIGPGTVVSAVGIGFILDFCLAWIPSPPSAALGWLYLLLGTAIGGGGIALTIRSGFGASPVDSFMLLCAGKGGISLRLVRVVMDGGFALAGWLLGGLVGIGTAVTVLGIGPVIQFALRLWPEARGAAGQKRSG